MQQRKYYSYNCSKRLEFTVVLFSTSTNRYIHVYIFLASQCTSLIHCDSFVRRHNFDKKCPSLNAWLKNFWATVKQSFLSIKLKVVWIHFIKNWFFPSFWPFVCAGRDLGKLTRLFSDGFFRHHIPKVFYYTHDFATMSNSFYFIIFLPFSKY